MKSREQALSTSDGFQGATQVWTHPLRSISLHSHPTTPPRLQLRRGCEKYDSPLCRVSRSTWPVAVAYMACCIRLDARRQKS